MQKSTENNRREIAKLVLEFDPIENMLTIRSALPMNRPQHEIRKQRLPHPTSIRPNRVRQNPTQDHQTNEARGLKLSEGKRKQDCFDRLVELVQGSRCVKVPPSGIKLAGEPAARRAQRKKIKNAYCFVKNAVEPSEVWLRPALVDRLLPDWKTIIGESPRIEHIAPERDRPTAKRKVFAKGSTERFYVFRFFGEVAALRDIH